MMQEDPRHQAIHLLLSIAWTDGKIAPAERAMLTQLIAQTPGAGESAVLIGWLDAAPPEPAWDDVSAELAQEVLVQALRLVMIDRVVTPSEQDVLDRLRKRLGLDDRAYAKLQQQVERELVHTGALG